VGLKDVSASPIYEIMSFLTIRPSHERGQGQANWLKSQFSFSFADYHDPLHMGFRSLRVINEDHITPSSGFPMHPHQDMEIITYVLSGALAHKDSLGSSAIIRPGEIQRMSAGTGIVHSEFNASDREPVHLLQIWIIPSSRGGTPSYAQQLIDTTSTTGRFGLIASTNGRDNTISVKQDVDIWLAKLAKGEKAKFNLGVNRGAWAQIARGKLTIDTSSVSAGDGVHWNHTEPTCFAALEDSEVLLFDLA
jgi:quercetin 2,3-dioxygenase